MSREVDDPFELIKRALAGLKFGEIANLRPRRRGGPDRAHREDPHRQQWSQEQDLIPPADSITRGAFAPQARRTAGPPVPSRRRSPLSKHTLVVLSLLVPSIAFADDPPADPAAPPPDAPAAPAPEPAPPAPAPDPKPADKANVATTPDLPAAKVETKGNDAPKLPLQLKPGGYVQFDSRRTLNAEEEQHEMTIRRLRFKLDGSAGKYFKFRTLIDFAGSKLVVDDAWGEIVIAPELSLRAGKDKSQFGIERLMSAAQLLFLERAYPTQLSPNRDIGIWARGDIAKGLVHYVAGVVDGVADNVVIEGETDGVVELNFHLLISPFAANKKLGDLAFGGATTFGRTHGTVASPGVTNVKSANQATIVKYASGMDAATTALADGYRSRFAAIRTTTAARRACSPSSFVIASRCY